MRDLVLDGCNLKKDAALLQFKRIQAVQESAGMPFFGNGISEVGDLLGKGGGLGDQADAQSSESYWLGNFSYSIFEISSIDPSFDRFKVRLV